MSDFARAFDHAGRKYHDDPTTANFDAFVRAGKRLDELDSASKVATPTSLDHAPNDPHPRVVVNGAIDGAESKSRHFTPAELESL